MSDVAAYHIFVCALFTGESTYLTAPVNNANTNT